MSTLIFRSQSNCYRMRSKIDSESVLKFGYFGMLLTYVHDFYKCSTTVKMRGNADC